MFCLIVVVRRVCLSLWCSECPLSAKALHPELRVIMLKGSVTVIVFSSLDFTHSFLR